jgi:tRNA-splicing ligase RtcB (3'-phosphate/5'-hydroxy nucleic acid ligase)
MEIFDNQIPVFGHADDRTLNQIRVCARTADKVALMPDNHVGYGVPIGGVVAYKNAISPTGVGYDIGCGNKAVRLDMLGGELRGRIAIDHGRRVVDHQLRRWPQEQREGRPRSVR